MSTENIEMQETLNKIKPGRACDENKAEGKYMLEKGGEWFLKICNEAWINKTNTGRII